MKPVWIAMAMLVAVSYPAKSAALDPTGMPGMPCTQALYDEASHDWQCVVWSGSTGSTDSATDTITLSTDTATNIVPLKARDYVKAAALIEWLAKDDDGFVKEAMEVGAAMLRKCAYNADGRGNSLPTLNINCEGFRK
jgi:hypothetical protein